MRKTLTKKMALRALGLLLTFSMLGVPGAFAARDDAAPVADDNLKRALLDAGADLSGDGVLSEDELAALTGALDLSRRSIRDISGLELAGGVTALDLSGNSIEDISALSGLRNLEALDISGNEISDIGALYDVQTPPETLVMRTLDVSENYLNVADGSGDRAVTDALIWRGCAVTFDPQKQIPVKGVSLTAENLAMCPGDTAALHAAVIPEDAAVPGVSWQSGDESVATVKDGVVTAVSTGKATITAIADDGGKTAACAVSVGPDTLASSVYAVDDSAVTGVAPMTGIDTFKHSFDNDAASLLVYDSDGHEYVGPAVSTGMTVKLVVGGIERDSRGIVVTGDASGDGKTTIKDYAQLCLDLIGGKPLDSLNARAGDYTQDGRLTIGDYARMRLAIMGTDGADDADRILPNLPDVADPRVRSFLDIALEQLGKPYVWGAEGPNSFDCSGFVYYCLKQSGYDLSRWTADMYSRNKKWTRVGSDDLAPGDLMFYYSDNKNDGDHIGHTGIYLGNGYHIHASSDYGCIIICGMDGWYKKALSHGMRVFE
jgi:hypothetical protein